MWISFRVLIALIAFAARFVSPFFRPKAKGSFAGQPWYERLEKSKQGDIESFRVGMPLPVPVGFRLQPEEPSDRWFKRMGLAHEFQTGDAQFDDAVYIACDHPALHRVLRQKEKARERVETVFAAGFRRIWSDGRILWIERYSDTAPAPKDLEQLNNLRVALADLKSGLAWSPDPFTFRVVAVEAITWSIFAYALGGAIEYFFDKTDIHVEPVELVAPGLAAGAVLFLALFGLIALFLRGSSRGSRILIEGIVLLALSVPIAGIQLVSDVNRAFDRSEPVTSRWVVKDKYTVSGRKRTTAYYVVLGPAVGTSITDVPGKISVASSLYYGAQRGRQIELQISRGALGFPWYRRITAL